MAEVLITLGIIGIVAAMTLPGLIQNYQKKQTANQLQKVYSLMSQVVKRAEADHESMKYWDFSLIENEFINKYFKPYCNVVKEYPKNTLPHNLHYYCKTGALCDKYAGHLPGYKIVLTDGTMLTFTRAVAANKTGFLTVIVDLNGFSKPNRYGRDLFLFSIQPEKGVLPYGVGHMSLGVEYFDYNREKFLNGNDPRACNKDGIHCAAVIMYDGWEIKKDYKW